MRHALLFPQSFYQKEYLDQQYAFLTDLSFRDTVINTDARKKQPIIR